MSNHYEDVELYPDEYNQIVSMWAEMEQKWIGNLSTHSAKQSFAQEMANRMASIGFIVEVSFPMADVNHITFAENGDTYVWPSVEIVGRTRKEEEGHDHVRHGNEVQKGFFDGKAGVIKSNGYFDENGGSKLYLPGR